MLSAAAQAQVEALSADRHSLAAQVADLVQTREELEKERAAGEALRELVEEVQRALAQAQADCDELRDEEICQSARMTDW